MICRFRLPKINPHMAGARIECFYAEPGQALKAGTKLLDLGVDLSSAFAQECPPVSFFRIVLREPLILRSWSVDRGAYCALGDTVAIFSSEADEDPTGEPTRDIRFAAAGIVHHGGLWTGAVA
jgi:hypothetical protein